MESNTSTPQAESLSVQARTYFLQQGQSTLKLYSILKSNLLTGFVKSGISVLFEIILFLLFVAIVIAVAIIPTEPIQGQIALDNETVIYAGLKREEITAIMYIIKGVLLASSLVPLALMVLLKRNRRKRALIEDAYMEVDMMKERFEDAVKGLKL